MEPKNLTEHLCFRIARTSRQMMGLYERRCRAFGLTPMQLLVLGTLQEKNAGTINDLATELGFDATTMTRIIQRMVDAKLVERIADPGDRRMHRVYLHKDAKRRLKSWMSEAQKLEAEMTARLSASELAGLERLLDRLDGADRENDLEFAVSPQPKEPPQPKPAAKPTHQGKLF